MLPFGISIVAAYASWEMVQMFTTVLRMVVMTAVWICAFALGTRLFWKMTGLLASK